MKKHIANILSACRIAIAAVLFCFSDITAGFLKLFCLAGLTDLLDGPIARLTNSVSILGSKLDTYGDILTYAAITKILLLKKKIEKMCLLIAIAAGSVCLISALIGFIRFNSFFFIHTVSGKLLGFCSFLLPFSYSANMLDILIQIICVVLGITAIESLIIQIKSPVADPDIKSALSLFLHK